MLGAIAGDVIGSTYEFDADMRDPGFELFPAGSGFTDDTVMTIAVADALLSDPATAAEAEIALVNSLQSWGRRYPSPIGGYGHRFSKWLQSDAPEPYDSWGNGAPMRVSSVGWLYDSLDQTENWAAVTARITHNHPEGIAGAQAVAAAIYLARTGETQDEIRDYVGDRFGYDLTLTVPEIRETYTFNESSQRTVPQALTCFLDASGWEQAVRDGVALGGDSDTIGAITGAVAQAAWGVPAEIGDRVRAMLTDDIADVLRRFEERVGLTG